MANKEPVDWITVNGVHIPIYAGQSKKDAIKEYVDRRAFSNEQKKSNDIKKQEEEAKKLNSKDDINEVDSETFNKAITKARESRPIGDKWRVDVHTAKEYDERGCKCFVTNKGSTVAVDKDGDIISVCKNRGDDRGTGDRLMQHAVQKGGVKLDSFAGNHAFYVKNGFEPVSWTPFNEKYAPDGWKESGCGKEPVVFYKYVGVGKVTNISIDKFLKTTPAFTGDNGYDDAAAYRDKRIKEKR